MNDERIPFAGKEVKVPTVGLIYTSEEPPYTLALCSEGQRAVRYMGKGRWEAVVYSMGLKGWFSPLQYFAITTIPPLAHAIG